jgi:GNAT superfamily N-acetyltransferase
MYQQRHRFLLDSTTRFMKATEAGSSEIISIARWHYYPDGSRWSGKTWQDMDTISAPGWKDDLPNEFNQDAWDLFATQIFISRKSWRDPGPCWQLMVMTTRESYRKRGVASLLIDWGIKKAQEDGAPAYLEASVAGRPVNERRGFQTVGNVVDYSFKPYIDQTFMVARIVKWPHV